MSKILACADGSDHTPSVCQHAAWAALRLDTQVEVLHVIDPHRERAHEVDFSGSIGMDAGAAFTQAQVLREEALGRERRIEGRRILEHAKIHLHDAGMVDERVILTQRHGVFVDTVHELSAQADMVVVGEWGKKTDGPGNQLGAHLEPLLRKTIRPVLVAKQTFRPVERFLIAYDGGPSLLKALVFLAESPLLHGAECHMLRAGRLDENAHWFLEEAAGKLREAGYSVLTHAIPGTPDAIIAAAILQESADLLVMGAYGHSSIRRLIFGSTTSTMIRSSPVPILLFH